MSFARSPDSGLAVILVTIGCIGLLVVWVPELRWFLAFALTCGVLVAGLLFVLHARQRAPRTNRPSEKLEPVQINFARLSVGGGLAGMLVVVGSVAALTIGLEEARWFFAATLASGLLLAVLLIVTSSRTR